MAARIITEGQFEDLRRYEDGLPKWVAGGLPLRSLVDRGLVERTHDDYRFEPFYNITAAGRRELERFRDRYGISKAVA